MRLLKASQTGSMFFWLLASSQMTPGFFLKTSSLYVFASVRGSSWGWGGERDACSKLLVLFLPLYLCQMVISSVFVIWDGFHTPVVLKAQSYRYADFRLSCVSMPRYAWKWASQWGWYWVGKLLASPAFQQCLSPAFCSQNSSTLSYALTPFFSSLIFQYKHFERSQSTGNTPRKHFPNFPTGPGQPSVV